MRALVLFAILSVAAAKPKPGGLWGAPALPSVSLVHQPAVHVAQPVAIAQPVVHAAPVAVAKPAATSYASFQQVVHPVAVAQPVVHAAPVVHAQPIVQTIAQPVVHAQPVVQKIVSVGSYGHGW